MKSRYGLLASITLAAAASSPAFAQSDIETVRANLKTHFPAAAGAQIVTTPIPGLYQLSLGAQVAYVSADGRYVVSGRLVDLKTKEDLTEKSLAAVRVRALAEVPDQTMIVFEATDEARHTITTFTDIDCPYCRKMHNEMAELNAGGIRVRYMLYPRAGIGSESHEKAVSVWCAPDQLAEMTLAKSGDIPEIRECTNPIAEHMALAQELGLQGTPYTITDTGRVLSGYLPAAAMIETLDADKGK